MSFIPFIVGLGTSSVSSFIILEKIRDRRCINGKSNGFEDKDLLRSIYNKKLQDLINQSKKQTDSEVFLIEKSKTLIQLTTKVLTISSSWLSSIKKEILAKFD